MDKTLKNQNVYRVTARSRKEIVKKAAKVRKVFNISGNCDITNLLEKLWICFGINYEIVEDNEMQGVYACTNGKKINIQNNVYINAVGGNGRDRFTIAHEIGHCLLNHNDEILGLCRVIGNIPAYESSEWQANEFASQLLCPSSLVKGLNYAEVAELYGVSMEVAEIQINKK